MKDYDSHFFTKSTTIEIMRKSLLFIALSGFASICNYATYPVLSRLLSPKEFIDITVALALFTQLSSYMLSIVALTIGLTKEAGEKNAKSTVEKLQTILSHMFVLIITGFVLVAPVLLPRLKMSTVLLLPIFLMLGLSLIMSIISGYLNGRQRLIQLGLAIAGSAILQLLATSLAALSTSSGFWSLLAMALAALVATVLVYFFLRQERLPHIGTLLTHKFSVYKNQADRSLIKYTALASFAALALNILLIVDLMIVNTQQVDAQLYTDIYVVSRIVFFAGMLLVWPFLSQIVLDDPKGLRRRFGLITAAFAIISVGAVIGMYFLGEDILRLLLGQSIIDTRIAELSLLSIFYKFLFLVLTTICLVSMVYRSYWAVTLPIFLTIGTVFALTFSESANTITTLRTLCFVATIVTALGVGVIWTLGPRRQPDL